MPRIHVCSLALIGETVERTGARSLVTLLNPDTPVVRPSGIAPERHLYISVADIIEESPGHVLPAHSHVGELLEFAAAWDREAPLLIHCFAGVSRSTAAAYICACALAPERDEAEIAQALRAASPTATPNARLVALADAALGREGRMSRAIEGIGRGAECAEGVPFALEIK
ncbi:MAG: tyrosine phosphatase family protein [Hyphomicrobiales bacterium]|nr:tyrosine phosphatase family protein [Hyphomicrobiales bacterium]